MRWFSLFLIAWLGFINMVWADDAPTDLKLVLDKQNIKIWSYQVPKSSLYGFKAVTTVKSTLAGLVGLITDTERANRWLYRTSGIDVLQRSENNQSFTIRVVTDFPWPFTDREALVDVRIAQDSKTAKVRIDSSESPNAANYPVKECCLRMPMVQGYWSFKPLANGMVEVTMSGHADPGGRIPATAVNFLIQEHPYNTLKGLRKIIGEPSYQKLQYAYIHELSSTP